MRAPAQEAAPARAGETRTYRVGGVVRATAGELLAGADVRVVGGPDTSRRGTTDAQGHFDLGLFERGSLSLMVRRLGYQQRVILIETGPRESTTALDVALVPVAEQLDTVDVSTSFAPTKLRGFYERSRQKRTFGRFFTQSEIMKMNPANASELLRSVPGVRLASNQSGGNVIRIRGCQPMVWIDDQRVPGAELDDLIVPSDIAAIEVYASSAGIPAQYLDRGNRLCGLILVWTRSG